MHVARLMNPEVATCRLGNNLTSAAELMAARSVTCLPVVDGDGTLHGILTLEGIFLAMARLNRAPNQILAASAMIPARVTAGTADQVVDVARAMNHHRVRHVPVVGDERELLGMITLEDMAAAAVCMSMTQGDSPLGGPELELVQATLDAIDHHARAEDTRSGAAAFASHMTRRPQLTVVA